MGNGEGRQRAAVGRGRVKVGQNLLYIKARFKYRRQACCWHVHISTIISSSHSLWAVLMGATYGDGIALASQEHDATLRTSANLTLTNHLAMSEADRDKFGDCEVAMGES